MATLTTPYNFIPAAPFVLYPEWAAQTSHDHPFIDGLSGELLIELTNTTPLCVGGKQDAATEQAAGSVYFYRTAQGQLAIPGSSLKGMLRNALAPVVFARMSQVEERKLSVRDISTSGTYYHKNIVKKPANAGWLRFHDGQWQIKSCRYVRLHQESLIQALNINKQAWLQASTVEQRYKLLNGVQTIKFDTEEKSTLIAAVNLGHGANTGSIVVTGQPGATYDKGPKAKKWEFVFYAQDQSEWFTVPLGVLTDFLFVHENSNEWAFLKKQGHQQAEIPVFWHGASMSSITSMGLASMYRLAQQNSLHDALRNISPFHLDDKKADLTELLFGRMRPEADEHALHNWGLRGRVNIGLLEAVEEHKTRWTANTVLSTPKPSFHPAYLKQSEGEYSTFDSKKPELRGWKRYPVKPENVQQPPRLDGKDISNKVKVRLETVVEGSYFTGRIRFHNLRPVELGALLWVLDFGGKDELRHALGMGKPYGLGQTKIILQSDKSIVIGNNRDAVASIPTEQLLQASKQVFVSYMDSVWQTVAVTQPQNKLWQQSPQVEQLLAMADPEEGERCADDLVYFEGPKPFLTAKKSNDFLRLYGNNEEVTAWQINLSEPLSSQPCNHHLEEALELLEEQAEQQAKKEQLEQARQTMNKGELALSEALEYLKDDNPTKTALKNAEKTLISVMDLSETEYPSTENLEAVLQRAAVFNDKLLNRACKKLTEYLANI